MLRTSCIGTHNNAKLDLPIDAVCTAGNVEVKEPQIPLQCHRDVYFDEAIHVID